MTTAPVGTVTLVFTDIQGSTALWEEFGTEFQAILDAHDALFRKTLEEFRGYEVKTEGDAFMIAFAEPVDGVAFCLATQERLLDEAWHSLLFERESVRQFVAATDDGLFRGLRVRMGVHTGEVSLQENPLSGRADYYGRNVNRAARVGGAGHGGQVVVSGDTWALVKEELGASVATEDLGEHRLKGLEDPIRLLQVLSPRLAGRTFEPLKTVRISGGRPYRGLASFSEEDAGLFFGREADSSRLADAIRATPLVTLTGASGAGKSSVLQAGVAAFLPGTSCSVLRPGFDPVGSLIRCLQTVLAGWRDEFMVYDFARRHPGEIGPLVARWAAERKARLVVVVDQAEELFTLCTDGEQRDAFAQAIASMGADAALPTRVVLSVRSDYFAELATVEALRNRYTASVHVLTRPGRDQLMETLTKPAEVFGYAFEAESLVPLMVDAVAEEPAALALLQFCADQLWEHRDQRRRLLTLGPTRCWAVSSGRWRSTRAAPATNSRGSIRTKPSGSFSGW